MPFEPGQSGNPNGARKPRAFAAELKMALAEVDARDRNGLRAIAEALISKAKDGDVSAIKEIADRIDGKVPQAIGGTDELDPIKTVTEVRYTIVDPKPPGAAGLPSPAEPGSV